MKRYQMNLGEKKKDTGLESMAASLMPDRNREGFIFSIAAISERQTVSLASSGSLKTVKGPSYSGLGVNSKSSMSSETISLLVMRKP